MAGVGSGKDKLSIDSNDREIAQAEKASVTIKTQAADIQSAVEGSEHIEAQEIARESGGPGVENVAKESQNAQVQNMDITAENNENGLGTESDGGKVVKDTAEIQNIAMSTEQKIQQVATEGDGSEVIKKTITGDKVQKVATEGDGGEVVKETAEAQNIAKSIEQKEREVTIAGDGGEVKETSTEDKAGEVIPQYEYGEEYETEVENEAIEEDNAEAVSQRIEEGPEEEDNAEAVSQRIEEGPEEEEQEEEEQTEDIIPEEEKPVEENSQIEYNEEEEVSDHVTYGEEPFENEIEGGEGEFEDQIYEKVSEGSFLTFGSKLIFESDEEIQEEHKWESASSEFVIDKEVLGPIGYDDGIIMPDFLDEGDHEAEAYEHMFESATESYESFKTSLDEKFDEKHLQEVFIEIFTYFKRAKDRRLLLNRKLNEYYRRQGNYGVFHQESAAVHRDHLLRYRATLLQMDSVCTYAHMKTIYPN